MTMYSLEESFKISSFLLKNWKLLETTDIMLNSKTQEKQQHQQVIESVANCFLIKLS